MDRLCESWLNLTRPWHVSVYERGYSRNIPNPGILEKMWVPVLKKGICQIPEYQQNSKPSSFRYMPYPKILFSGRIRTSCFLQYSISRIFQESNVLSFYWGLQSTDFDNSLYQAMHHSLQCSFLMCNFKAKINPQIN